MLKGCIISILRFFSLVSTNGLRIGHHNVGLGLHNIATKFVSCFSLHGPTAVSLEDSLSNHVYERYRIIPLQDFAGVSFACEHTISTRTTTLKVTDYNCGLKNPRYVTLPSQ